MQIKPTINIMKKKKSIPTNFCKKRCVKKIASNKILSIYERM